MMLKFFKKYKIEIILFAISLVAHFFFFFLLLNNYGPNSFYNPNEDTREFFQLGKNLYEYGVFSDRLSPPFYLGSFRTIFFPAYLAFFRFFSDAPWLPIVFQNIIGAFSIIIVYRIFLLVTQKLSANIWDKRISFLSGFLFCLDPLQNYLANIYLPDTLLIFFIFLSTFLFFKFWLNTTNKKYFYLFFSSLFLGLSALTKPVTIFYLPIFCLFILINFILLRVWKKIILSMTIFILTFFLIISPWLYRNWVKFGVFNLSAITGFNLYLYANEIGPYPDYIENYLKEVKNKYGFEGQNSDGARDIRVQKKLKELSIKRIMENPIKYSKAHLLGMLKFFLDDGHKAAYYNSHYKVMLFYNTPEPTNKPNISAALKGGNLTFIWQMFRGLNKYMIIYLLSKVVFLLGYIVVFYGLLKSYQKDKKLFSIFLLFLAFSFYIAVAAGPWGAEARYRLPIWPWLLLIFSYGIFQLKTIWKS